VHVLECREIENYLLDSASIAQVLSGLSKSANVVSADEIEHLIAASAESLKAVVVLKRVCARLEPLRYVDNDLRSALTTTPNLAALIAAVGERISTSDQMKERIQAYWREEQSYVDSEWSRHWRSLAPGSELLDAVWRKFANGRRFDKRRDGPALAMKMVTPPAELENLVAALCA
jgi:hypothetical protein